MNQRTVLTYLAAAIVAVAMGNQTASAQQDSGTAAEYPWSGYWWAHEDGGLTGPLAKYDKVFKTQTAAWERVEHVNRANVQSWFGHCHAWSAAAVTEKEPRKPRTFQGVEFGVGDLKGLLTAVHAQDEANSYGDRFGDRRGTEDKSDLSPDEVWRLLQLYVKQRNIPLIFDLEAGDEVWNYPVYQYEVNYTEVGNGVINGTMDLVVADDDVEPDYLGTQPGVYSYTFTCRMQNGSMVSGSGRWTGDSVDDHPDFAWYPYVARAENPGIDAARVSQIVGTGVGGSDNPPDDEDTDHNSDDPPDDVDVPPSDDDTPGPADPVDFAGLLSPIEMVSLIANKTSHFGLDIFVDRNDGGKYRAGEPVRVAAESDKEGYLYLFDIDPQGKIHLVFPRPGEPNLIPANKLIDIPARDADPWFIAQGAGEHHLRGIVTTAPLTLTGFHTQIARKDKEKFQRGVQKMRVPPATQERISKAIDGFYGAKSVERKPTPKVKAFAQDDCLFFVTGKRSE